MLFDLIIIIIIIMIIIMIIIIITYSIRKALRVEKTPALIFWMLLDLSSLEERDVLSKKQNK